MRDDNGGGFFRGLVLAIALTALVWFVSICSVKRALAESWSPQCYQTGTASRECTAGWGPTPPVCWPAAGECVWVEEPLVPAVQLLSTVPLGQFLLESSGVRRIIVSQHPSGLSYSDPPVVAVTVRDDYGPATLASLLTHELYHAWDSATGALADYGTSCMRHEINASLAERETRDALGLPTWWSDPAEQARLSCREDR